MSFLLDDHAPGVIDVAGLARKPHAHDVEGRPHVETARINAHEHRMLHAHVAALIALPAERIHLILIDLPAERSLARGEGIALSQGFAVDEHAVETGGVDGHHGPSHIRRLAVVDAPAISQHAEFRRLLERLQRHHEFHRAVAILGHVERGVTRAEHGHHDWGDETAVGRDDVLERLNVAVEVQIGPGVAAQEIEGGFDGRVVVHGRDIVACGRPYHQPRMTLVAVSIAVHAADEVSLALQRARAAAAGGANLIEWRIDALAEEHDPLPAAQRLVRECPRPCIVTCRPTAEGGEYGGDDSSRISLFEALAAGDHPPRYIDVELATYERSENLRQKVHLAVMHARQPRDLRTSLILSTHDLDRRPADLLQRVERMTADDACAVIKVAWMARSLRDNLEAFELLATRRKPTIALCMGPFGLMSRVLAPKFGGFLTFASDSAETSTAPGQLTIEQLRSLYRFDAIGPETKVYGVVGWPVEHSRSPEIHNAAFGATGHDGVYLPLPVPGGPTEYEHFKATVGAMIDDPRLGFRGASVTVPHKESLVRFLKERGGRLDEWSERIGAANTLIVGSTGATSCVNTDAPAAVDALCEGMRIAPVELSSKRIAVLGAGGVARAVAGGLLEAGATVVVFNRTEARATQLVADLTSRVASDSGRIVVGRHDALACGCFHAFINCTSMGMQGGTASDESPLPDDVPLNDEVTVMDTVYAPLRTPLIQLAESRGARVITGDRMFSKQAARQFEWWTGTPAPIDVFRARMSK